MEDLMVKKSPLPWWIAGIALGLIQVLAVGIKKPLGVSTQFVVVDTQILKQVAPEYTQNHPLISSDKYQKPGYGFSLDIGLIVGAGIAALVMRKWKLQKTTVWWRANNRSIASRFIFSFIAGILILLGARMAHGCTSGAFASGWAQLSLSAVPFTITLFGFGMLTAYFVYPKNPKIEE